MSVDASDRMRVGAAGQRAEDLVNVAAHLPRMAALQPHTRAVVFPAGRDRRGRVAYSHLTFLQLNRETDRYAHGLERIGITRGTRTILMVRPSIEFFALTFALFKVGAVVVLVDPGMGVRKLADCLGTVRAEAFIGIPPAHVVRKVFGGCFRTVKTVVTVGRRWFWGGYRLEDLREKRCQDDFPDAEKIFLTPFLTPFSMVPVRGEDAAAILFTTGSTGPPKGALYTHSIFNAQVQYLRSHFGIAPGEIDLPTFPLFALFGPALGMTAVIPDMDPTRPAHVDPRKIIEAIGDQGATNMFGSPALLDRVGRYGAEQGVKLPSLRRVISAGAPMPPDCLERFAGLLSEDAEIHTPYGATEALPVASIEGREILGETRHETARGGGTCVGRPMKGLTVRMIRIQDEEIAEWSDDLAVPAGQIGEIAVKGPVVTREYYANEPATRLAKIREGEAVWHRMGDVGRVDERGRVWFCGRKAHRVVTDEGTLFTIPCEAIFNQHPYVRRSALVGVGKAPHQRPVLCVELEAGHRDADKERLTAELLALGRANALTRSIQTILYHPGFPVDIRHNAKIFREKLAPWAAGRLR